MQYKIGMYGGSFDPLHIGHLQCMINAASMCERLYIVLSYSRTRDFVPMEYRYRWIYNSLKHLNNVSILVMEDTAKSKEEYDTADYWQQGRDFILSQIETAESNRETKSVVDKSYDGMNDSTNICDNSLALDVVFCGSDYEGSNRYEDLYGCKVHYFSRSDISISSSQIRENPYKYWEYIPKIARPYFVKKVLIIGGESTGKSTLVENLALAYNTNFLAEVGREVCAFAGAEELMVPFDFQEILLRHKVKELDAIKESNKILFVDTDALTTKFYSRFLIPENSGEGVVDTEAIDRDAVDGENVDAQSTNRVLNEVKKNDALADAINAINHFDLILFLEPTVAFYQDGTRSEIIHENREKYSQMIKDIFDEKGLKYHCIGGDYVNRLNEAKKLVDAILAE